jgi:hypothetical protein
MYEKRLCTRTQVVMPAIASKMIMPGIIPSVSKTNGIESTPSPICVFIMRIDVPIQPTYVRYKERYSMDNGVCDLHLGTVRYGKELVSELSKASCKALLCNSHWVRLLGYHQRQHQ